MSGWTTVVQAETLSIALGRKDLAIVDCRFSLVNPAAGEFSAQPGLTRHSPPVLPAAPAGR